jgi:hypothetical protein
VAQAIEEFGELEVEVAQEGVHAHDIGQCHAQAEACAFTNAFRTIAADFSRSNPCSNAYG